jgi:hypothetical protein
MPQPTRRRLRIPSSSTMSKSNDVKERQRDRSAAGILSRPSAARAGFIRPRHGPVKRFPARGSRPLTALRQAASARRNILICGKVRDLARRLRG